MADVPSEVPADGRQTRLRATLEKIADALGVPVETLIVSAEDGRYSDEAAELVRLFLQIRDPLDRRRLMELAQRRLAKGSPPPQA